MEDRPWIVLVFVGICVIEVENKFLVIEITDNEMEVNGAGFEKKLTNNKRRREVPIPDVNTMKPATPWVPSESAYDSYEDEESYIINDYMDNLMENDSDNRRALVRRSLNKKNIFKKCMKVTEKTKKFIEQRNAFNRTPSTVADKCCKKKGVKKGYCKKEYKKYEKKKKREKEKKEKKKEKEEEEEEEED